MLGVVVTLAACNGPGKETFWDESGGVTSTADGGGGGEAGSGGGGGTTPINCDDGNACTTDAAVDGTCEHLGAIAPSPCTTLTGDDGLCVWDLCVSEDCANAPDGTFCMSDFPNVGKCEEGACAACATATDCDDGNPCTLDYCQLGGCYNPEDTSMSPCGNGHCFQGSCCQGCVDPATFSCVETCAGGQACSAQGMCPPR